MPQSTRCTQCGHVAPLAGFPYHCQVCGGILLVEPDLSAWPGPEPGARGLERYRWLLPLASESPLVSLGEGDTPLMGAERLAAELNMSEVLLKNETVNPTGSFKDRALSVMTTRARDEGYRRVISSSSGNAGAASAAYAARAGLGATVLVPETTRVSKLAQILVHGAQVIRVRGSASDTYRLAKAVTASSGWANLTTTFLSPLATAGFKTIGYELAEQAAGRAPDWVIAPISAGPILVGVATAFREFRTLGRVDRVPRMVCAQATGCAPIVRAFEANEDRVEPWRERPDTIATAIADPLLGYAADGTLTLQVVRETGGHAIAVDDNAIRAAIRQLAKTAGVFAEPAGAVPIAALAALRARSIVSAADRVVCLITGHGLKDALASESEIQLPLIEPDPLPLFEALGTGARTAEPAA